VSGTLPVRYRAEEGFYTRLLRIFEWCSLKLADITIATNESYKQMEMKRANKNPETIFIVRNGPDKSRMSSVSASPRLKEMKKCILCYVGSLNPRMASITCFDHWAPVIQLKRLDFYCVIMGSGDSLEDLRAQAREIKLEGCVELTGFVSDKELQANLAGADICVDPDPSSPLNDVSTWIKIMEYMSHAKPIVTFDLKETRFSAGDAAVYVEPNNEAEFAKAIAYLMDAPELRRRMGYWGRRRVENDLQWSKVGRNLLVAYNALCPRTEGLNSLGISDCPESCDS
jgi:glycosyltransferase involved in cell wall biosynthesis